MPCKCETIKKQLQIQDKIIQQMERAIKQMLLGGMQAYHLMRGALQFAEEQRKEMENDRRIQDLPKLEDAQGTS